MKIIISTLAFLVMISPTVIISILIYYAILALRKYLKSSEIRSEKKIVSKSLAEALKENRIKNKMSQEFVAEQIGVSRQAVSKWESGKSDPNTSNLYALAQLYKISAEELLNNAIKDVSETKK